VNLKTFLSTIAFKYGPKPAVICGDARLSYAELEQASNRAAHALKDLGIGPGDRVAFLLGNSPEFLIAFFGVVKIGAIAVPLDPKYKLTELISLLGDCRPKMLLTESPCLEAMLPFLPAKFPFIKRVVDFGGGKPGVPSFAELLQHRSAARVRNEPKPGDLAVIAYTSGASFRPRGIMLTHQSICTESEISGEGFAQTEKDVVSVFALPLHHAAGLTIVGLTSLYRGSTLVMMPGITISSLLEGIEKHRVTLFIGVPFIFSMMNQHAENEGIKNDISSLRLCASGGSPLSVEVSRRFKELYGYHIAQFWGLTEITAHITIQAVDGSGIPGSIGNPLRGCEVEVVDRTGRILQRNRSGELICRGPLMKGYYNNPEATAEVMKNGWLYTGDIGHVDYDGNIFITGRKKDLIIPKGQNIAPDDIEFILLQSPKVAEAAVLGAPDDARGEVIVAVVRLKDGEAATESEMKRLCLDNLANFKIPKEFRFVDFPLAGPDSPVNKDALRERLGLRPVFSPSLARP
jgi:long-chain acyl-CoA synthetase